MNFRPLNTPFLGPTKVLVKKKNLKKINFSTHIRSRRRGRINVYDHLLTRLKSCPEKPPQHSTHRAN